MKRSAPYCGRVQGSEYCFLLAFLWKPVGVSNSDLKHNKKKVELSLFPAPLFTSTHVLTNPPEPCPPLQHRAFWSETSLPGGSVPLGRRGGRSLLYSSRAEPRCVSVHAFICLWLRQKKKTYPVVRLAPLCHRLRRTGAQTHAYILHAVFRGLNDRGDRFPCGKRRGTSYQHGPLHLSDGQRTEGRGGDAKGLLQTWVSYLQIADLNCNICHYFVLINYN